MPRTHECKSFVKQLHPDPIFLMCINKISLLICLQAVCHVMGDTPERQLITSLLPPSTQLGMSREDFNELNLEVLHMPGTEKSANAWVLFKGPIDYKRQSILFLDGRMASATCSWKLSSQGVNDFERLKRLFVSASDTIVDIEIGKRTKMNDPARLSAKLVTLKSGIKLVAQANEIEISMILFDEALIKGKPSFLTFDEVNSQKPYKGHFLEGVQFPPTKPQNNQIISVRDYLKDGFPSSLPARDLHVQHKSLDFKMNQIVKSVAVSEHPTSSTPWSVVVVLIVAACGLLWLLVKKRN